jgi:hypothetical protein
LWFFCIWILNCTPYRNRNRTRHEHVRLRTA